MTTAAEAVQIVSRERSTCWVIFYTVERMSFWDTKSSQLVRGWQEGSEERAWQP